jgi:hypothetical protein
MMSNIQDTLKDTLQALTSMSRAIISSTISSEANRRRCDALINSGSPPFSLRNRLISNTILAMSCVSSVLLDKENATNAQLVFWEISALTSKSQIFQVVHETFTLTLMKRTRVCASLLFLTRHKRHKSSFVCPPLLETEEDIEKRFDPISITQRLQNYWDVLHSHHQRQQQQPELRTSVTTSHVTKSHLGFALVKRCSSIPAAGFGSFRSSTLI